MKATIQRLPGFGSLKKGRKAKESRKGGQGKANKEKSRGQPHKKKQARDALSTKEHQRREGEVRLALRRADRIEGQKISINRVRGQCLADPGLRRRTHDRKEVLALRRTKRREGAGLPFAFVKCNPQRNEQSRRRTQSGRVNEGQALCGSPNRRITVRAGCRRNFQKGTRWSSSRACFAREPLLIVFWTA